MIGQALLGLVLATGIAAAARRAGALSPSGAVAAATLGAIAVTAGWSWAILLILSFTASSLLSRHGAAAKSARSASVVAKGGARDAVQVLANGGPFAAAALAALAAGWDDAAIVAAGALAAATADTWATEIGSMAPGEPRSMITGRPVPVGTSGGVTLRGTLASVAGAGFIAVSALLVGWPWQAAAGALAGGIVGSLVDSLLGATIQSRRRCPACAVSTERVRHGCGTTTLPDGGIPWLSNDAVNLVAALTGAIVAGAWV